MPSTKVEPTVVIVQRTYEGGVTRKDTLDNSAETKALIREYVHQGLNPHGSALISLTVKFRKYKPKVAKNGKAETQ